MLISRRSAVLLAGLLRSGNKSASLALGWMLAGAGSIFLFDPTPVLALTIETTYESSWATAPSGATADVNNVINQLESDFNRSNVTINIQFGWGDINGAAIPANDLGVTNFPQNFVSFPPTPLYSLSQVNGFITAAAAANPTNTALNIAANHLPSSYPGYTNPGFFIPDAQYLALTGKAQNSNTINAYIGFGTLSGSGFSWSTTGGQPGSTQFDLTSVLEHEITHALGRVDYAFSYPLTNPAFLTLLDLFKFNKATNTRDPRFSNTNFSIDGGMTYPTSGTAGVFSNQSDSSDWQNILASGACPGSDSFDACLEPGILTTMSSLDLTEMCALGWSGSACGTVPAVPLPAALPLFASGLVGLLLLGWRRKKAAAG